jgi:membrane-bound metal-dependent hydrolase YbcI (DUF457 family)
MARQHEATGLAMGLTLGSAVGANLAGALLLGLVGTVAVDLPDICSPRARIVGMLCLFRYRVPSLDKNGVQRRSKPRPIRVSATGRARGRTKGKARGKARAIAKRRAKRKLALILGCRRVLRWLGEVFFGISEPEGELMWIWRSFPGHQLHRLSVRCSEAVFDRWATDLDRSDSLPNIGVRFRSHRGLTHSVWAAGVVGALVWILGEIVGLVLGTILGFPYPTMLTWMFGGTRLSVLLGAAVVLGMLTHILGDACTDMGVSPFAPLIEWKGRRYPVMGLWEPMRFKAGQWMEESLIKWACYGMAGAALLNALGWLSPLLGATWGLWTSL